MMVRGPIRLLLCTGLLALASPAPCEFHTWTDDDGARRVSNVAPDGVDHAGRPRRGHHPNSVAAQHAALRERLEREGRLIAAEAAARAASARPSGPRLPALPEWLGGAAPATAPSAGRW